LKKKEEIKIHIHLFPYIKLAKMTKLKK